MNRASDYLIKYIYMISLYKMSNTIYARNVDVNNLNISSSSFIYSLIYSLKSLYTLYLLKIQATIYRMKNRCYCSPI